jgi:sigma-B regulation protein RsbU (phosphoserine phosphatase)
VYETGSGTVAFAVGDVAGKGLPAAMLMGMIYGALRTNPWHGGGAAQEGFAARLNAQLYGRTPEARFASLFWGAYDPRCAELGYISAGHCPGFLLHGDEIRRLDSTGPVLGLLREPGHRRAVVNFRPGDLLVLYSDGVVEAEGASGEEFGEERLTAAIAACAGRSAAEARREIMRCWRAFLGGRQPEDDLTLLVLEAGRPAPALAARGGERMVAA